MKERTLRRVGAALTAACVFGTTTAAFAAPAITNATYDKEANALKVQYTGVDAAKDSTLLVFDLESINRALNADDITFDENVNTITYVDQKILPAAATEADPLVLLMSDYIKTAQVKSVWLGMGGEGVNTPARTIVKLVKEPTVIKSYDTTSEAVAPKWADRTVLLNTSTIENLPTSVTATVHEDGAEADTTHTFNITWKYTKDGVEATEFDGTAGVWKFIPEIDMTGDPGFANDDGVSLSEITVTVVNEVTVKYDDSFSKTRTLPSGSDIEAAKTAVEKITTTVIEADVAGVSGTVSFTWGEGTGTGTEADPFSFTATGITVAGLPEGVTVTPDSSMTLPTVTFTVSSLPSYTIDEVEFKETASDVTVANTTSVTDLKENAEMPKALTVKMVSGGTAPANELAITDWTVKTGTWGAGATVTVEPVFDKASIETDDALFTFADDLVIPTVTVNIEAEQTDIAYGDVDNNGEADSTDATYVFQVYMGIIEYKDLQEIQKTDGNGALEESEYMLRADVDKNGDSDSEDATYIFQKYMGIIEEYPTVE